MTAETGSTGDPAGVDARASQSPVPPDFEQAVEVVGTDLDLVQTHFVDKFPNSTVEDIGFVDPDGSSWRLSILQRNAAGKVSLFNLSNPSDSDQPEAFNIGGRMSTRPSAVSMITTDHVDPRRDGLDKETPLQIAELAGARLRSILGIPEESETALERLVREEEAEADADPTGQARAEFDDLRKFYASEKDRVLARIRQRQSSTQK